MGCDQYTQRLTSYVDEELSPEESRVLENHLKSCESCTAEVQTNRRLKRELRAAGNRYVPSLAFRRRVEAQIAPPQKSRWIAGWLPRLALASMAIAVAILGWNQLRHRESERILAELVDVHVSTLASASPVDVLSTDRHTVKPWFQGKIPFTFNLPELKDSAFTLLGGRVAYLQQQPAAQLLFEIRQHKISVFIQQDRSGVNTDFGAGEKNIAFTARSWENSGLRYFLISDVSPEDADTLVRLFKSSL